MDRHRGDRYGDYRTQDLLDPVAVPAPHRAGSEPAAHDQPKRDSLLRSHMKRSRFADDFVAIPFVNKAAASDMPHQRDCDNRADTVPEIPQPRRETRPMPEDAQFNIVVAEQPRSQRRWWVSPSSSRWVATPMTTEYPVTHHAGHRVLKARHDHNRSEPRSGSCAATVAAANLATMVNTMAIGMETTSTPQPRWVSMCRYELIE